MDRIINYNFYHWGPFLYKTSITNEELKKIKPLCKKDKRKDTRKNLAGLIRHEYKIDSRKIFPILVPYFKSYLQAKIDHYGIYNTGKLTLENTWVNYMTKFESNPLHNHDGDLSFVLFTKIPDNLKKEIDETISNKAKPGAIYFVNDVGKRDNFITTHSFLPEIKDLYIFPSGLGHFVNSFKSDGERISISGNIKFK